MGRNYSDLLEKSLDGSRLELLHLLAYQASLLRMPLYLVGGVVRDILLGRPVKDFDLVVEGDSAAFAEYIVEKFGGRVLIHSKFRTATWVLNETTFKRLDIPSFQLLDTPLSFDLISARTETYTQPGALPTVKRSTIADDLRRRDFTINAMAFRLDGEHFGEIFDPLDGQKDIEGRTIKVLHAGSFLDDPTRIFRAIRYEARYRFEIHPETISLINSESLAVLRNLSRERIRHELDLIFEEHEVHSMFARMLKLEVLDALDLPLFKEELAGYIEAKPEEELGIPDNRVVLGYLLWLTNSTQAKIQNLAQNRLSFTSELTDILVSASNLKRLLPSLKDKKPSGWTFALENNPLVSVYGVYLITREQPLMDYLKSWRHVKPSTTGGDLKQRGLEPGPKYGEILRQLRAAWLDGDVKSEEEEK
ncbi:MAG TPA: hypothetical protein VJ022_00870, partial [Anaerolineales bacterium]|nr:hypothetical protein [Anaerolineales bacterium]